MSEPVQTQPATAAPAGGPARADVIHDIGYRHYDGPRLGRGYATRSLFVLSLRGSFGLGRSTKSKILPIALLVAMCLPALIIVAVTIFGKLSTFPVDYPAYLAAVTYVIAVFVAAQAPVALSRDLRFSTLPLYFSRPLTASDYVRAKFGAMAVAVFVLTALPMLIMWIGSLLASMPFAHNLEHFAYGLVAAALYALVFSAIGSLIASTTPRRGFGVVAIIAVFLITSVVAGTIYLVLDNHGHHAASGWPAVISPGALVDTSVNWMFDLGGKSGLVVPSTLGGIVFLVEIVLIVAASYGLLVRRYRKI